MAVAVLERRRAQPPRHSADRGGDGRRADRRDLLARRVGPDRRRAGGRRRRPLGDRLRRRAGSAPRSTSRSPTCRCATCSTSGSGCPSSSTTTRTSPRSPRPARTARSWSTNLVMLTVGTGVGGGIVVGGRLYRGASGAAAELGHTMIGAELDRRRTRGGRFPQRGLARVARRRPGARPARRRDAAEQHPDSALGRLARRRATRSPATTPSRRAKDGDEVAIGLLGSSASGSGSASRT